MAGEYEKDLLAAYRMAYDRLMWEGWQGELDQAIADAPEISLVHFRYRRPDPILTTEQQQRVDQRVGELLEELL